VSFSDMPARLMRHVNVRSRGVCAAMLPRAPAMPASDQLVATPARPTAGYAPAVPVCPYPHRLLHRYLE